MQKILIVLSVLYGGFCGVAWACESNEIDINGDGTQCETAKFTITTTNLSANATFKVYISASGTFYIDCGTDGTLSGVGVSNKTINHSKAVLDLYTCTYSTGGSKTVRMGGRATGYSTNKDLLWTPSYPETTITFTKGSQYVAAISGSLGQIFPTLGTTTGQQPRFYNTFHSTKITSIPEELFDGVVGAESYLFEGTFRACTQLRQIPEKLFAGISGTAYMMFGQTFWDCTRLETIPANLFSGIRGNASYLFWGTFFGCTSLTTIPSGLFAGVSGSAKTMFDSTFEDASGITTIPADLFAGVSGCAESMFQQTFLNNNLTSIPDGIFSGVSCAAKEMFKQTFSGCSSLQGYIPPSAFAGLIENNSPYDPAGDGMMYSMFSSSKLSTICPSGTTQYITGYESYWNGRVSCVDENLVCGAGEYLPAHWYECKPCPENNYCPSAGTYAYSETNSSGATACPNGTYSPAGMWEAAQCGRILHVGDGFVYLRATKKTSPALHLDLDHDGVADYFGNMTTMDVPMSRDTQRKLKVRYNNITYSIYDDSVELNQYQN